MSVKAIAWAFDLEIDDPFWQNLFWSRSAIMDEGWLVLAVIIASCP